MSQVNFKRLSRLDQEFRKKQSNLDRTLIANLSKVRERLAASSGSWEELKDPQTNTVYYLDVSTGHSQWERPSEMDCTTKEIQMVTCAICLDICLHPTSCPNGHLYCLECLRSHLRFSQHRSCPSCRICIEGDGVRNMLAEDLSSRLRKAGKTADDDDDEEDDKVGESKWNGSGGGSAGSEEKCLQRHQAQVEEDIRTLENAKRMLSKELQSSCSDLREAFEQEWMQMCTR